MNLTYRVTGRYMTGSTVTGYHLVGEDGSQVVANKERIIYMIGRGQIENMRLQISGSETILRGKGINLNNLPIYDMNKNDFRGNQASQNAASTNVVPKNNSGINPMGQLKIVKRIMYKTNCLGYIVVDHSGNERKLSRRKVIELAIQRLISNAVVQNYTPKDSSETQLILRGIGCDISKLPQVTVDQNGNIIDQANIEKKNFAYMRAARTKNGGILHDRKDGKKIPFEKGDYIICGVDSKLRTIKSADASKNFTVTNESNTAICDNSLDNLAYYQVEIFGKAPQSFNADQVKRWPIIKVTRA